MALEPVALSLLDRPHLPQDGELDPANFKEWWHFNLLDDAYGLDLIVNLSLSGDITRPAVGEANLIVLAHEPAHGWTGGVRRHDGLTARVETATFDIQLDMVKLRFHRDRYVLKAESERPDGISVDVELVPRTEPMVVWKNTPIGSGHINWLITPYLEADGTIRVADRQYRIAGARAYHDHNWGRWLWGDNFGWDWGFCSAAAEVEGAPMSLVYDRTVDRAGHRIMEHSLALWHGESLLKFFPRQQIRMQRKGFYRQHIRRIPGVAGLIDPASVATVPGRIDIEARDGDDWVDACYIPDAAIQIAIPREVGFGLVQLNETLGWLTLSGSVAGLQFAATRRSCFEFVG